MQNLYKLSLIFLYLIIESSQNIYSKPIEENIPVFWENSNYRTKKPLKTNLGIRFIVTSNHSPFSFIDNNKVIRGFNADLARAICTELNIDNSCLIQALPWQEQIASLSSNPNTVLMSGIAISTATRRRMLFTRPYLTIPARFVAYKELRNTVPIYKILDKKRIGVINGTAHEAYLKASFGGSRLRLFLDSNSLFKALEMREVDAIFSDALSTSSWLHSSSSSECCSYLGGPFISQKYFGNGFAIATSKTNVTLRDSLNYALQSLSENGKYAEIYMRYFPVSLF